MKNYIEYETPEVLVVECEVENGFAMSSQSFRYGDPEEDPEGEWWILSKKIFFIDKRATSKEVALCLFRLIIKARIYYITPWAIMALATFMKPATLAPFT